MSDNYEVTDDDRFLASMGYRLFTHLKPLGEKFTGAFLGYAFRFHKIHVGIDTDIDWIREGVMGCIELGLAVTSVNVLRLLRDRDFFESRLPYPMNDDRWGSCTGTELLRQWWLLHSDQFRSKQLEDLSKALECVAEKDVIKMACCTQAITTERWGEKNWQR